MGVLKIKFENWNFEEIFENYSFENYLKMEVLLNLKIIWEWNFWKLNLKIGILENYLRMKFKKIT